MHEKKTYHCDFCGYTSSDAAYVQRHEALLHKKEIAERDKETLLDDKFLEDIMDIFSSDEFDHIWECSPDYSELESTDMDIERAEEATCIDDIDEFTIIERASGPVRYHFTRKKVME